MSVATYDVATDTTACGCCKAGEHGRCRGGGCTCQRPFCVRRQAMDAPRATTRPASAPPKEITVPTPIAMPPATGVRCDVAGCDYAGSTSHGLAVHRARSHKIAGARNGKSHPHSAPARKAPAPTPPPSPKAAAVAVAEAPALLEALVAAPGEWAEVGRVELATRNVDGRMGVFARFVPTEGAA